MHKPFIMGDKVYLRAVEIDDLAIFRQCNNQPELRHSFFIAFPTNLHQQQKTVEGLYEKYDYIPLIICDKSSERAVGVTAFHRVDLVSRMCAYSIRIADPADWGKGFGSEVTRLMVAYGFETLNLNRIQLHVWTGNKRGIRAYEKAGFSIEGTLRQAMYHNNEYCDFSIMSILRDEYYEKKKEWKEAGLLPPEGDFPKAY